MNFNPSIILPTNKCKKCRQEIPVDASVCYQCGSAQDLKTFLLSNPIEKGTLLVSIAVLCLSVVQFLDTRSDLTKAQEALSKATIQEGRINVIYLQVDSLNKSTRQTAIAIEQTKTEIDTLAYESNQTILASLRNQWLQGGQSLFALNPNSTQALRFVRNINDAVTRILKDSSAISQWWKETEAQNKQ